MVQITKVSLAKHRETLSPYIDQFCTNACILPLTDLKQHLDSFPSRWPFPRGDLYHWTTLLNRFDKILENFCSIYKLDEGPQMMEFGCKLSESDSSALSPSASSHHATVMTEESEGDRVLVESILDFSRMLLENCGNRSIYASSLHLDHLLNSTSLSLIESTLRLGVDLAQRYQAAMKRQSQPARSSSNSLLMNHYNIKLDKVLKLAQPFSRVVDVPADVQPSSPVASSQKGKEKATANTATAVARETSTIVYAEDLVSMAKGGSARNPLPSCSGPLPNETNWGEWGDVKLTYHLKASDAEPIVSRRPSATSTANSPVTPTPVRRHSILGPNGQRANRQSMTEDPSSALTRSLTLPLEEPRSNTKTIEILGSKLKSIGIRTVLKENAAGLSDDLKYELLAKLRVANALMTSLETRRQILAIRILAVTNLAYIYLEFDFLEKVLKQDSEEPQRLQLPFQLAELIHPPTERGVAVPMPLQTTALSALEALAQYSSKFGDVCKALQTPVNHGILLYVVRKAVHGLSIDDDSEKVTDEDPWRTALFGLLSTICQMPKTAADLVTAGLIQVLIEVLTLRNTTAERIQPKVLAFLDTIIYNTREAFQTLVSAEGLNAISNLIVHEVTSASDKTEPKLSMPTRYRTPTSDYEMPFPKQQTLKWLFKFIHHMMSTAGSAGGNFDRLLQNLIDTPPLLNSLRQVISSPQCFGSTVWTNSVSIFNDFINNEPTSFSIIAEAGLSKALLETITSTTITMPTKPEDTKPEDVEASASAAEETSGSQDTSSSPAQSFPGGSSDVEDKFPHPPTSEMLAEPRGQLALGIMPSSETISIIPQAFSAICLNHAGMEMFRVSGALAKFFEIFESPEHVKCMHNSRELPQSLGITFDELIRHHPSLRHSIMRAILDMVVRVGYLCRTKTERNSLGAKLWAKDSAGEQIMAGEDVKSDRTIGKSADTSQDVEMRDAGSRNTGSNCEESMASYIGVVALFLQPLMGSSTIRADFSAKGGYEYILDLAESPCLPFGFADASIHRTLQDVISLIAESKSHLIIPSLLKRAQMAVDVLAPFAKYSGTSVFFEPFVHPGHGDEDLIHQGTILVKALVNVNSLVTVLQYCLFRDSQHVRRNTQLSFNHINVSDMYVKLVRSLGPLLGACIKEGSRTLQLVPEAWKRIMSSRNLSMGFALPQSITGVSNPEQLEESFVDPGNGQPESTSDNPEQKPQESFDTSVESIGCKNFETLRYLENQLPGTVKIFFQTLGKALLNKRCTDYYQRQTHTDIADALADAILQELKAPLSHPLTPSTYGYWIQTLGVLQAMLLEESRHDERPVQIITAVLRAFTERGGILVLNKLLNIFATEIRSEIKSPIKEHTSNRTANGEEAALCLIRVLRIYGQLVNGKNLTESIQSSAMVSRQDRGRLGSDKFAPSQLLVEVRMAVLPAVRLLWESDILEEAPSDVSERLIEVVRFITTADCENLAFRRSDNLGPRTNPARRLFKLVADSVPYVAGPFPSGNQTEKARNALYRCNNQVPLATEFRREHRFDYPLPEGELEPPQSQTPDAQPMEVDDPETNVETLDSTDADAPGNSSEVTDNDVHTELESEASDAAKRGSPDSFEKSQARLVTVDDLQEARHGLQENMINRCLDIINAHGEVTFDTAELLAVVVDKAGDTLAIRKDMAETLVVALMSFAGEDDLRTSGKKIAAYAHLLALMLRDKQFYAAAVDELKDNLVTLLSFVQIPANQPSDEPSSWVPHILLNLETLLTVDAMPLKTRWTIPKDENDKVEKPILEVRGLVVSEDNKANLLEAILDILPRIGKDESLALAVLRILVILTRNRSIAIAMGEKRNIQRLFVMAKQLAGASSARIQGPLLIILRHIVEDTDTIKQIMRSEIKAAFERPRTGRGVDRSIPMDTYTTVLASTALRAPQLFVNVTNEMVKLSRWSYPSETSSNRSPVLVLKENANPTPAPAEKDDSVQPTVQATEDLSIQDVKPSTEQVDSAMPDANQTPIIAESKQLPVIENPDGVIHFLLCELLNYRDVGDKDPAPGADGDNAMIAMPSSNRDISMSGSPETTLPAPSETKALKPSGKQELKAKDHPIYVYRCFLLQCLTELLSSYNRTKLEFINFKRSAPPQATTSSKPRSSVVNYLLYDLLPIGTITAGHLDNTVMRKKMSTANWADSVLTALLSKTGERSLDRSKMPLDGGDDELDLQFVRRFVLDNILRAYKDASASLEDLDVKYSRMLVLASLMYHLMVGNKERPIQPGSLLYASHEQLKRLMFEKGFVAALTTSIADIDLKFDGAKRVVKHILLPLNTLTSTAVELCTVGLISEPPHPGEADEIESATSVSDAEEGREDTPDLFRNSTLGMFEQGDGESSSSDEDDEEMYEREYDDEMEYEEDMPEDDEDNISDEDEDIEGMEGIGDTEGLPGNREVDVEVIMEEDDQEDDEEDDGSDGDESDGSEDSEDDDTRLEILDEAGNIHEVTAGDDIGDWESDHDDDEEDYEGQSVDFGEAEHSRDSSPLGITGSLIRAVAGHPAEDMLQQMEAHMAEHEHDHQDHGGDYDAEEMDEEEDDEYPEEDDEVDEDGLIFGGHSGDVSSPGFGWGSDIPPPVIISHRGPHRSRNLFIPGGRDTLATSEFLPPFGSHRPVGQPTQSAEDGTNPLFRRNTSTPLAREISHRPRGVIGGALDQLQDQFGPLLETLMSRSFGTVRNGQSYQFHIAGPQGELPAEFRALISRPPSRLPHEMRLDTDPVSPAMLIQQTTKARWEEESKLLFGSMKPSTPTTVPAKDSVSQTADILQTAIQALLVPPAIEDDKTFKAAETERARKDEEQRKRLEEERIAKEAQQAEEAAQETKEAEAQEAGERAAAEAAAPRGTDPEAYDSAGDVGLTTNSDATNDMDAENAEPPAEVTERAEPAQPAEGSPRIMTSIRGTPYDITDLGIDADFLAELPEELREEVIMSRVAERRSQAAATGAPHSDIDQEFLDALPVDIREEIVQQERQDRRRREREEARRQAAAQPGAAPNGPQDMDTADFLVTLAPALRQQVLMESDDALIETFPPEFQAQARALQRQHIAQHSRHRRFAVGNGAEPEEVVHQRAQRRPVVQMLDRPGVATLLRLMFIHQHEGLRSALNSVLQNVCQNKLNRAEVISTLLNILQEGSADVAAIERSFAALTIRAKLPKDQEPKTPQPLKRTLTGTLIGTATPTSAYSEAKPIMVVQQCLRLLVNLTESNQHVQSFFLTEHEVSGALKRNITKKGKGKDNKAHKFALNSVLSLLDRDFIMESTSAMDSLSVLLDLTTSPLQFLERKQQREAVEEARKTEATATAATAATDQASADASSPTIENTTTEGVVDTEPTTEQQAAASAATYQTPSDLNAASDSQSVQALANVDPTSKASEAVKETQKKQRSLMPPVVPEHNIKLVINIFVSRECTSKVFQKTISAIKNLSIIPGAKTIFGRELISRAKSLGEIILQDLDELLPQIQQATTGTQIQGIALAKFTPESSDQRRLLRVLTALDHLFDPKQDNPDASAAEFSMGPSHQLVAKHDLLSPLYSNGTFGSVWEKLSACLRTIRQREQMMSVATILLPLIEALMVVCKNTTSKETSKTGKDTLMSPVPESRMGNLFLTFTEEHRKILNDLVRHTPKLMSGSFKMLVKNPKVLEFDNKRNYFNRSMHDRTRNPPNTGTLQLSVRRGQVFHDSFKALYFQTADQMKFGKLSIRFHGEEGVDAGGVTREWFQVLSRQMFDPGYALFIPVSSDRTTFHPNQLSSINEEHLMFFKFIGRIIGKALYEGRLLDCHFSRAVYKRILGKSVSVKDMESLDPDYYKSLVWMLENDITDIITETFSVDNDKFGVSETIDFVPNGRKIPVTEENKHEYVRLMVEWKLTGSVKEQLDEFLKGFHDIIPEKLISIFNEQELELLISGLPDIDVPDWKRNTEYHNYSASSPQIQWYWRAVRSFDKEERAKLLQFVTGTSKVPLNGFKELEGMNGFSRFNIHRDYGNKERLPSSHTCFNQLDLPEYESYEALRAQVLTAITQGSEYFGFA